MLEKPPPSDSALIVGALFVACITVGVGFLADPFAANRVAAVWNESMLAATETATQNSCLKPIQISGAPSGAKDFECLNGCVYVVSSMGTVNAYGTPNPKGKPGQEWYQALFGKPIGPKECSQSVRNTAMNSWNDLNTSAFGLAAGTSEAQIPASLGGSTASNVPLSSVVNNTKTTGQGIFCCDANGRSWDVSWNNDTFGNTMGSNGGSGAGTIWGTQLPEVPKYGNDLTSSADLRTWERNYWGIQSLQAPGTLAEIPSTDLVSEPTVGTPSSIDRKELANYSNSPGSPAALTVASPSTVPGTNNLSARQDDKSNYDLVPNLNYLGRDRYQLTGWSIPPTDAQCARAALLQQWWIGCR